MEYVFIALLAAYGVSWLIANLIFEAPDLYGK